MSTLDLVAVLSAQLPPERLSEALLEQLLPMDQTTGDQAVVDRWAEGPYPDVRLLQLLWGLQAMNWDSGASLHPKHQNQVVQ